MMSSSLIMMDHVIFDNCEAAQVKTPQVRPTDRVAWILISALGSIIVITLDAVSSSVQN